MTLRVPNLYNKVFGARAGTNQLALESQGDFIVSTVGGTELLNIDVSAGTMTHTALFPVGQRLVIEAKATSYTVLVTDSGKCFTTTGASGAVTFTLPALTAGFYCTFLNTVAQNLVITAPGDNMIYNNDTITTATWSTAGDQIGAFVSVICDGTNYFLLEHTPAAGFTVGTAS